MTGIESTSPWWREELDWRHKPNLVSTHKYKEISCAPRLMLNKKDSYKERIPKNMLMRIPIWKRLLSQGKRGQPFSTIKTSILSLTKVRIINSLWHSVRNSNLAFGGYLAGTTPVFSVRSSFFVLCRCCFEHVQTV